MSEITQRRAGRKIGRREALLRCIPNNVAVPKHMTTDELAAMCKYRASDAHCSWEDAIYHVIKTSDSTLELR